MNKAWKAEKYHLEECMKRIQHADTEFNAVNLEGIIKQYIRKNQYPLVKSFLL